MVKTFAMIGAQTFQALGSRLLLPLFAAQAVSPLDLRNDGGECSLWDRHCSGKLVLPYLQFRSAVKGPLHSLRSESHLSSPYNAAKRGGEGSMGHSSRKTC
jgi:hypothetical protein